MHKSRVVQDKKPEEVDYLITLTKDEQTKLRDLEGRVPQATWGAFAQQQRIRRFLPFAVSTRRHELFQQMAEEMDWAPRTQLTYWNVVRTGMKILDLSSNAADAYLARQLSAKAITAPSWDIDDPKCFLQPQHIHALTLVVETFAPIQPLVAAFVALMLGQRCGDVLKLHSNQILQVQDWIAVCFLEGKVTATKGPFTIFLPKDSLPATMLRQAAILRASKTYIFLETSTQVQAKECIIHQDLSQILGFSVDLRALRRTGLSRLAASGCPLQTVLAISRHSSIRTLELYLHRGCMHGDLAVQMSTGFAKAWSTDVQPPRVAWQPEVSSTMFFEELID